MIPGLPVECGIEFSLRRSEVVVAYEPQRLPGGTAETALRSVGATATAHIDWPAVESYRAVRMPNARGRYLAKLALGKDQWRALWVPPTMPPYELQGPFAGVRDGAATKTLVFSGWKVVPPSLAGLIGYEAERRAADRGRNDPEARKKRSSRHLLSPALKLNARTGEEQLQRVAVRGLVYPSAVLAAAVDPYRQRRSGRRMPSLREVLAAQSATLRPLLRELADREEGTRLDPRWYWAAPMLLDQVAGLDVAALIDDDLSPVWASDAQGATASSAVDASLSLVDDVLAGRVALGTRPRDLLSVVAQMAVGGLGVCALRGLCTVLGVSPGSASSDVKAAAGEAAWGCAVPSPRSSGCPRRSNMYSSRTPGGFVASGAVEQICLDPQRLKFSGLSNGLADSSWQVARKTLSSRFAAAFGAAMTEEAAGIHPEVVRRTFNSPFWPWVLVTTSVGQEGLDFHRYCHSVVHWNVPATPVELEQREGRVQRYKSHSVRRNLAVTHGPAAMRDGDPWRELYDPGEGSAAGNAVGDFVPEWGFPVPFGIERHVPAPPYSRDGVRFEQVRRARVYYRMVLGQPNPDELVEVLMENMPESMARELVEELRLDLRPRRNRGGDRL
jgi:Helicase conserved C-terminal domain